ncbi:MAG: STAS domain-containing protein [Candidatus Zixiibacteriota bacterium]
MEITTREANGISVLTLSGRLDLASGTTLKEHIKGLIENEKTLVHLNLTDVEFINSSGLGAMVSIMKEVRLRKGRLTISNLASYVQEIFEITQLSHIFEIFATEEEALGSAQPAATR